MTADKPKPSIYWTLQSDYWASLGMGVTTAIWLAYLFVTQFKLGQGYDPLRGVAGSPFFFYLGIFSLVAGVVLFYWRLSVIWSLFKRGVEVTGTIEKIAFHRDRGRVRYTYTYQDKDYHAESAIFKTKRTQGLREGLELVLIVDPDKPQHALIRALYIRG
ncbi:MAG: DUF3592 domain-containing protein [Chloroflexota bacterium]|nr:DUF3592 domain-containing protein [Chloroflexota bacterium]